MCIYDNEIPFKNLGDRKEIQNPNNLNLTYLFIENKVVNDPINVEEALSSPDSEMWQEAMLDELESFQENEFWTISLTKTLLYISRVQEGS